MREKISLPTPQHPAARIWKETDLKAEISQVKKQHQAQLTAAFTTAQAVIQRMLAMGWLQEIELESPAEGKSTPPLYLVDMEAAADEIIEPSEILQGFQSDGVICYAGALAIHELTTQVPAFYHIAVPRAPKTESAVVLKETSASYAKPNEKPRDPLGRKIFDYQGIPCYLTRPEAVHMPGVQTRIYGARTHIRITTPEQTMLDTLWQPGKCGGQAIAFEAWERGVSRWNEERMAHHLEKIQRGDWIRRVGAMLTVLGVTPVSETLRQLLESQKCHVKSHAELPTLTLLNRMPAPTLLPEWGVLVP